jgi:uncharacterized protein YbjQ (UPF0145 family)
MVERLKVISVIEGLSADTAGIKAGDILEKYNDIDLVSEFALTNAASSAKGNTISLTVSRRDGQIEITLPAGRLGIGVLVVDYDKNTYYAELDLLDKIDSVLISTTSNIEGFRILKYKDIISAEAVCGVGVLTEIFASFSDTFGGRNKSLQNTLSTAKQDCLSELKKEAVRIGANAVIGIDLDYNEFSGQGKSMLFVIASGTAVNIEAIS